MNKKVNILVLGISGNVSQGIIQVLRDKNNDFSANIIGACIFENSVGKYMVDKFYVSPYANNPDFVNWLINICNKEHIDLVLSGVEENIYAISENINKLSKNTSSKFVVAPKEQLKVANDKLLTCQWLKENGCNYPLYADAADFEQSKDLFNNTTFPIIAKPKNGKGSKGIFVLNKKEDVNIIKKPKEYILEEYLGSQANDDEYTVATYTNFNGEFQDAIIMKRVLQNGTTVLAESVSNNLIYEECKKITQKMKIKGPLNIQLKLCQDKPVCFELNMRFSGTVPVRHLLGYQDVIAAVQELVCNKANLDPYFNIKKGKVYRSMASHLVEV